MSSPESMDELTGDSNIQNASDEKSRDSQLSHESKSSLSGNPMEPVEGVLDFEVDAPDAQKDEDDNDGGDKPQSKSPLIHDELSREGEDSKDGELSDSDVENVQDEQKTQKKKIKTRSSDLEDGEVTESDEDGESKPITNNGTEASKSERPPVCRFFSRGQCTWGSQCRFVHPGLPTGGSSSGYFHHASHPRIFNGPGSSFPPPTYPPAPAAPVETAWERGLRNAKELLKEASRRREEDPAFEDRRLHQGLQESPPREAPLRFSPSPSPPLRSKLYGTYEKHREAPVRSVSPLNMDRWREERHAAASRARPGIGDNWKDPWMRAKSPGHGRPRRRSRSSTSRSYSSSASSRSSFSSSKSSSRSRSRSRDKRRNNRPPQNKVPRPTRQRYPSERNRQFVASPSPSRYRGKIAPPLGVGRPRRQSSSSSSSTSKSRSPPSNYVPPASMAQPRKRYSRSRSPEMVPRRQRQPSPGRVVAPQIKMNLIDKSRKLTNKRPFSVSPSPTRSPKQARVSPSPPPPARTLDMKEPPRKKVEKKTDAVKREELMKQLKAVEDAIAKKKAKT